MPNDVDEAALAYRNTRHGFRAVIATLKADAEISGLALYRRRYMYPLSFP